MFIFATTSLWGAPAIDGLKSIPLQFEANTGQTDPQVRYLARGAGYTLFLTRDEAALRLPAGSVSLRWLGTAERFAVEGERLTGAVGNYFVGDRSRWKSGVPNYERVHYRGIYPGIDAVYYGRDGRLEYDLVVAPHADLGPVRLRIEGADALRIGDDGDLSIELGGSRLIQHRPVVYQVRDGRRVELPARYVLRGAAEVGFEVAAYDRSQPLVIDPVLSYSTYLGGTGGDTGNSIAVDSAGNAYILGTTLSANFTTAGGGVSGSDAYSYAFVTKIGPSGSLIYSSLIGGTRETQGRAIAVDSSYVYITGMTRALDFPTQNGFKSVLTGPSDGFVAKLTLAGD